MKLLQAEVFNHFGGCWNEVKSEIIKFIDITHPKSHEQQWSLPVFPSLLCGQHQPVGLHSQCCQEHGQKYIKLVVEPTLENQVFV